MRVHDSRPNINLRIALRRARGALKRDHERYPRFINLKPESQTAGVNSRR